MTRKKTPFVEIVVESSKALISGFIIASIFMVLVLVGSKSYANINANNVINTCKAEAYDRLIKENRISPTAFTEQEVVENCNTVKDRVNDILDSYAQKVDKKINFPVYITGYAETSCSKYNSLGCVKNYYSLNENIKPVMDISYAADYYKTIEHTVAHEYVHVLTSNKEKEALWDTTHIWGDVYPSEGVADCGVSYFTETEFAGGFYMNECSPEQTAIAHAVITDTFVP